MFERISQIYQRFLLYGLILTIGLPLAAASLFLGAPKASASEKKIPSVIVKIPSSQRTSITKNPVTPIKKEKPNTEKVSKPVVSKGKKLTKTVAPVVINHAPVEVEAVTPSREIRPHIDERAVSTRRISQTPAQTVTETPKKEETKPTPTPSASPSESAKAGGWNKLLVALSILIIAAGAAIGGYYGYEWLMLKGKDKEPPESDSSSRW